MATNPYVYVGNLKRGDGTTRFRFKSSEDDTVYEVPLGGTVDLNAADLERLNDSYILTPEGEAPGVAPSIRPLSYIDEGAIPTGYVLKRTSRGFEFELDSGGGGGHAVVISDTQPSTPAVATLWVKTVAGTPAPVEEWEVFIP